MSVTTKPQRARNRFLREEKQRKASEAAVRKELAAKRTPEEQLARLDAGGYVATKERAKLTQRIISARMEQAFVGKPVSEVTAEAVVEALKPKKGAKARKQAKNDKKAKV